MIPVAMGVLKPIGISINPMIASLAMVLSSITVIINTLRLKKQVWKGKVWTMKREYNKNEKELRPFIGIWVMGKIHLQM